MYLVEARFHVAVFFLVRVGSGCAFGVVGVAVGAHPCQCFGVFLCMPLGVGGRLVVFFLLLLGQVCCACVSVMCWVGGSRNSSRSSSIGSSWW